MDMRDVGGWAVVGNGEKEAFRLVHVPSSVGPGAASQETSTRDFFWSPSRRRENVHSSHTHLTYALSSSQVNTKVVVVVKRREGSGANTQQ